MRHVVTGIRGRRSEVEIDIEEKGETYCVSCPKQTAKVGKARKRWKASFDLDICRECCFSQGCPTKQQKSCRAYYFTHENYLAQQRWKNLQKIPEKRHKIRPNVEATVKEFSGTFNHKGKLPYRGRFRTEVYAFCKAIGINFGRVVRHKERKIREKTLIPEDITSLTVSAQQKLANFAFWPLKTFFDRVRRCFVSIFTQNKGRVSAT